MIYDVVVVGGGIAGLMAAIEAKTDTNKVALITKGNLFKSNSSLASGGINAVLNNFNYKDVQLHIDDTMASTYGLNNKTNIEYMCSKASSVIDKMTHYGVDFDKDEKGHIAQRSFGGGSDSRTCFVGDTTGSHIIQVLIRQAKSLGITFLINTFIMNLTTYNGKVSGVIALRRFDSSVVVYLTKSVVLAGGGYAGIYRGFSTNASDYTGDILAIALRAGLRLVDMEFVQFHPTGFVSINNLISEAARGEGGFLVNNDGDRFVNELDKRDIVARAINNQIISGKKVFLDLRHLGKELIEKKLPSLYKSAFLQAGIDLATELLPVKPVAHYTMGGIEAYGVETNIKGLFVCGECASNGVHGANRLGGNSLLDGAVFGELAGRMALEFSRNTDFSPIDYEDVIKDIKLVDKIFDSDTTKNFNAMRISLGNMMFANVGIQRNEEGLMKAYDYISYLRSEVPTLHCVHKERTNNVELVSILELRNATEVAEAVILSALKRKESRGAHYRSDYSIENQAYKKSIVTEEIKDGILRVYFKENKFLYSIRKLFRQKAI